MVARDPRILLGLDGLTCPDTKEAAKTKMHAIHALAAAEGLNLTL